MTTRNITRAVCAAVLVAAASIAVAAQTPAAKIDLTGAWTFSVSVDGAVTGTPTVTLKQEGEKITGHYSSQTFGEVDVTGTLKGQDLTFKFSSDALGAAADIVYAGKVENNDSIKGTVDLGGAASGTFDAARKK